VIKDLEIIQRDYPRLSSDQYSNQSLKVKEEG
jgi:hypothetical protein